MTIEFKEPIEEKPIDLGLLRKEKDKIESLLRGLTENWFNLCGLMVYSIKFRHLFWETEQKHEWHFIVETDAMQEAFSIYEEDYNVVCEYIRSMTMGVFFLLKIKRKGMSQGIKSFAVMNLAKFFDENHGFELLSYRRKLEEKGLLDEQHKEKIT